MKTNTVSWTTKQTNEQIAIRMELKTSEFINLDGHVSEVAACSIVTSLIVDGVRLLGGSIQHVAGREGWYAIDGYGISPENYARIEAAKNELEAEPEWIANEKMIADRRAAHAELDKHDAAMSEAMGY